MNAGFNNFLRFINNYRESEEGSAIVEFVVLGLPLFLPLFIFLTSLTQISSDQRIVQSLARQVARGFVTAPDEENARARVEVIKGIYQERQDAEAALRSWVGARAGLFFLAAEAGSGKTNLLNYLISRVYKGCFACVYTYILIQPEY